MKAAARGVRPGRCSSRPTIPNRTNSWAATGCAHRTTPARSRPLPARSACGRRTPRCASWCARCGPRSSTRRLSLRRGKLSELAAAAERRRGSPGRPPGRPRCSPTASPRGTRQVILRAASPPAAWTRRACRACSTRRTARRSASKRARLLRKDGTSSSRSPRASATSPGALVRPLLRRARAGDRSRSWSRATCWSWSPVPTTRAPTSSDYFGDFAYLQATQARRISDYVLLGPAGRTFYASATPLKGLVHTQGKAQDGSTWQRWTAREVPKLVPEPSMPGYSEMLAYVHVSTYRPGTTWAASTGALVRTSSTSPTTSARRRRKRSRASTRATSRRASAPCMTSSSRAPATSAWSSASTPSSPTRWRPSFPAASATARTRRRFMHAMLESLGIDSRLTLLRMKRLGSIAEAPASLAVFNHAILYVPKYDLFLDGTAEFHGSRRAARRRPRRGSAGGGARGRLEVLPHAGSEPRRQLRRDAHRGEPVARRQRQGDGQGQRPRRLDRRPAPRLRARRRAPRPGRAAAGAGRLPQRQGDGGGRDRPPRPGEALPDGDHRHRGNLRLSARARPRFGPSASGRASWRRTRSSPGAPCRSSSRSRSAPPSTRRSRSPTAGRPRCRRLARESGAHGAYEITYSLEGGRVVAHLALTLNGGVLQPVDYGAFRAFLGRLDEALHRRVEAAPATQTAAR